MLGNRKAMYIWEYELVWRMEILGKKSGTQDDGGPLASAMAGLGSGATVWEEECGGGYRGQGGGYIIRQGC